MAGRILYDNRLTDAIPVASTTETGFAVANLTDWRPYTQWKPTALPATITVDCGAAKSADYALVWGHDLGTQGAVAEIRGSTDNFAASDVLVASDTPADDAPIALYFTAASFRYWRLTVTGSTVPTIGIAAIGARLDLPRAFQSGFDPVGREPMGPFNRSVTGQPLGRALEFEEWSETVTVPLVAWDWLRSTWIPAWSAHLAATPFALDWDAAGHPAEIRLVAAKGGFTAPHRPGAIADLAFDVFGAIEP